MMRVWLLSSGSSGNVAVVESGGARLMIDAGLGPRVCAARMRELGADLFPRGVDGIVVTHHHGDHIAHLEPLARALRAPIYLHRKCVASRIRTRYDVREYGPGSVVSVGPFELRALPIPHDAPQMALSIAAHGRRFGIATDLGHVPAELAAFLGECDAALVEANYCSDMLAVGPYRPRLRARVGGAYGHLANWQTAELARHLEGSRLSKLWLGHISLVNNTPALALATVRARAPTLDVEAIPNGAPRVLLVEPRHEGRGVRWGTTAQLAFSFPAAPLPACALAPEARSS